MKERPREFKWLAWTMVGIAISIPVQVWVLLDGPPLKFLFSLGAFTPLNGAVMALALLNAFLIYQAARSLMVTSGFFVLVVTLNNYQVAETEVNYSSVVAWFATLAALAIHGVLLRQNPRAVLLQPSLRWWKTPVRKKSSVQATVFPVSGGQLLTRTFDISEGGAFVMLGEDGSWDQAYQAPLKNIVAGKHCTVRIKLDQLTVISCNARVVRRARECGAYPEGFALQFTNLNSDQKRTLKDYVQGVEFAAPAAAA